MLSACMKNGKTTWEEYAEYRELNNAWLAELQTKTNADGTPYYTKIEHKYIKGQYVLIHYFNDTTENSGKLSPEYTSTVDVRYVLHSYDGTAIDSSTNMTTWGKGIFRSPLNEVVLGWPVALSTMHCGDTAEIIVPYQLGYQAKTQGNVLPYSNLRFNVRLVDIPHYETPNY